MKKALLNVNNAKSDTIKMRMVNLHANNVLQECINKIKVQFNVLIVKQVAIKINKA